MVAAAIIVGFVISTAFSLIALLSQRRSGPGASDFSAPRVEDGAVIPIAYGTFTVSPIVPWWGDVVPKEVKQSVPLSPDPVIGHDYYVGLQAVLCWGPIDKLLDIVFDDTRSLADAGPQTHIISFPNTIQTREPVIVEGGSINVLALPATPSSVNTPSGFDIVARRLFSGIDQSGVAGIMRFYWGGDAQPKSAYLESKQTLPLGATQLSGFPQLCYAVFEAFNFGRSPYLRPMRFVLQRCPNVIPASGGGLHGKHQIAGADGLQNANGAHAIYELLTDTGPRGCKIAASLLDPATFRAAADTLHAEGFGLSIVFDGTETGMDCVEEILRHIGGALRVSRATGLIELKLLRADYLDGDLIEITPDHFDAIRVSRPEHRQLATEVALRYTDRARNFRKATERAWNQSHWDTTGERRIERVEFLGITDRALAQKVVARECAQLSLPLAKMSGPVDRRISALSVGDVFLLTSPEDGCYRTPMRLLAGEFGSVLDGKIHVDAIEDLYAAQGAIFAGAGPGGTDPGAPTIRRPIITVTVSATGTQGSVELTIADLDSRVTLVEFNTKSGANAESGWITDPSAPYIATVALDPTLDSRIAWRVSYTAADGTTQQISDSVVFPAGQLLRILSLTGAIDGNGLVTITATTTPDITSVKCAADTAGYPSDATVRAQTADASAPFVFTFGPLAPGQTLYVKAFGYDSGLNEGIAATAIISRTTTGEPFTVQAQFGNRNVPPQQNDEWAVEMPASSLTGPWRIFAPDGVSSTASIEVYKIATDGTPTLLGTLTVTSAETASGTLAGAPIAFAAQQRVLFKGTNLGSFTMLNVVLEAVR